jgi:flagellar biosynthesis GTPase FlhF
MQVQELPTKLVTSAFEFVRRPVTVVGDHLGPLAPRDVECWPPVLGIDAVEGAVKETMGSLLRDPRLRESGRETRRSVEQRRAAATTEATAEALQSRADEELDTRREAAEDRRTAAEEQAASRKRSAAQQGSTRSRSARARAAQREAAVERAAEDAAAVIEREGRERRLEALETEADALATERAELAAEQRAREADAAIERSRARRSD